MQFRNTFSLLSLLVTATSASPLADAAPKDLSSPDRPSNYLQATRTATSDPHFTSDAVTVPPWIACAPPQFPNWTPITSVERCIAYLYSPGAVCRQTSDEDHGFCTIICRKGKAVIRMCTEGIANFEMDCEMVARGVENTVGKCGRGGDVRGRAAWPTEPWEQSFVERNRRKMEYPFVKVYVEGSGEKIEDPIV
ncbi:hypothetical protein BJ508DRAFT_303869 [Ascobolus immersus RN42]|uniref:Uncharacterized protein n=1 Tax=Ascobolus immersus RN42 TaxID=1160509 RepID=A0A3N4IE32_ASCIM|nr:hypothetical protein BJ508DRAFT_303869 [Ascobolus immersus RN42]